MVPNGQSKRAHIPLRNSLRPFKESGACICAIEHGDTLTSDLEKHRPKAGIKRWICAIFWI